MVDNTEARLAPGSCTYFNWYIFCPTFKIVCFYKFFVTKDDLCQHSYLKLFPKIFLQILDKWLLRLSDNCLIIKLGIRLLIGKNLSLLLEWPTIYIGNSRQTLATIRYVAYLVYNACTHTHMKVYTHACMHTLTCIHTHASMHTHACLHTHTCMYTHACTHMHACPCMHASTNWQYSVNCKLIYAVNPNWYNRKKYWISTMLLYIYDNIYIGNYIIDGQVTFIDIRRANTLYWLCQVCTV